MNEVPIMGEKRVIFKLKLKTIDQRDIESPVRRWNSWPCESTGFQWLSFLSQPASRKQSPPGGTGRLFVVGEAIDNMQQGAMIG